MCKQIILTTITAVLFAAAKSTNMLHMHDLAPDSHITVLADQVQWKPAPASLPRAHRPPSLKGIHPNLDCSPCVLACLMAIASLRIAPGR